MKKLFVLISPALLFLTLSCETGRMTLEQRLSTLPVDTLFKIKADTMFSEAYEISFIQPVDHNNADGPVFHQQVFLDYVGPDAPVVVVTEGYGARNYKSELADILKCNQIIIEHRYFEESTPDSVDWKYLTTWQAATDQHRIIEMFKPVFRGRWLTTGISKGGQTVMYHSFYYPDDVDVRVPYVGPLNFGPEDSRMAGFLSKVGDEETRNKVFEFQKLALEKSDILLPMLLKLAAKKNWTFNRVGGPGKAYEMTVMEYEFAFWQWGSVPGDSVPLNATDEKIFNHLSDVADFSYFADQGLAYFEPFFYQAMTEIGYYGYQFDRFKGLFKYAGENGKPEFLFSAPQGVVMDYNYDFAKDVDTYLKTKARHFIYIYGEYDPWSASAVDPGDNTSCIKMVRERGSHSSRIRNLSDEQQQLVLKKLGEWMEIKSVGR